MESGLILSLVVLFRRFLLISFRIITIPNASYSLDGFDLHVSKQIRY